MGFAPTWLRQVSLPLLHMITLTAAGKPSHYVTCRPGQLSLPFLRGRLMSTSYSGEVKGRYGSFRLPIERVGVQVKL